MLVMRVVQTFFEVTLPVVSPVVIVEARAEGVARSCCFVLELRMLADRSNTKRGASSNVERPMEVGCNICYRRQRRFLMSTTSVILCCHRDLLVVIIQFVILCLKHAGVAL